MESFDLIVIGGGPAGYVAAIRAALFKMKVLCVDERSEFGGTCLNVGCIPSKSLLYTSHLYDRAVNLSEKLGMDWGKKKPNLKKMMELKSKAVEGLTGGVKALFNMKNVTHKNAKATFTGPGKLQLNSEGSIEEVQGTHIIIATGSSPIELPFMPFDEKVILSSTGALSLTKIPSKMAIVGAGVIGVELGSVYSRLGTQVTVLEMLDHICPSLDKEVGKHFQRILESQGLAFNLSASVKGYKTGKKGVSVLFEKEGDEKYLDVDCILVAVGRKPNTEGLGLEAANIEKLPSGHISVNELFQTSAPGVYAIGDVIEGPMLAHRASEEAIAIIESIQGNPSHVHYYSIPDVVYTEPEVAGVGLTEEQAKAHFEQIIVGKHSFKGNPRARCSLEDEGFVKVIFDKKSSCLIGMHILGPHASELVSYGMLAIEKKVTMKEIALHPFAHPTLSESIKEAALKAMKVPIHQ